MWRLSRRGGLWERKGDCLVAIGVDLGLWVRF